MTILLTFLFPHAILFLVSPFFFSIWFVWRPSRNSKRCLLIKTSSVIVWSEMLWTTIVLFPIFYLIQDLMKIFCYVGEIRPIFASIILYGCSTCLILLFKNLVVTSPFWAWGPLASLPCNFRFFHELAYCCYRGWYQIQLVLNTALSTSPEKERYTLSSSSLKIASD